MRVVLFAATLIASCWASADEAPGLQAARKVASSVPPKLLQVLVTEIDKGGPESAINVCRDKAPEMARSASEQTGWTIRRVSLRNRNPKAVPDPWERAALEDFDRRAAAGESPATLEKGEIVSQGTQKEYRYMKALPVQQICIACHGPAESLSPAVTAQLKLHFPDDKAIGYSLGQIRGAMTIRKAM